MSKVPGCCCCLASGGTGSKRRWRRADWASETSPLWPQWSGSGRCPWGCWLWTTGRMWFTARWVTCFVVKAAFFVSRCWLVRLFQELIDIKMAQCRRVVNGGFLLPAGYSKWFTDWQHPLIYTVLCCICARCAGHGGLCCSWWACDVQDLWAGEGQSGLSDGETDHCRNSPVEGRELRVVLFCPGDCWSRQSADCGPAGVSLQLCVHVHGNSLWFVLCWEKMKRSTAGHPGRKT